MLGRTLTRSGAAEYDPPRVRSRAPLRKQLADNPTWSSPPVSSAVVQAMRHLLPELKGLRHQTIPPPMRRARHILPREFRFAGGEPLLQFRVAR